MNLKELLQEWLIFRTETVRRRLQHRLEKIQPTPSSVGGVADRLPNIDEVIRIIRREDRPDPVLNGDVSA